MRWILLKLKMNTSYIYMHMKIITGRILYSLWWKTGEIYPRKTLIVLYDTVSLRVYHNILIIVGGMFSFNHLEIFDETWKYYTKRAWKGPFKRNKYRFKGRNISMQFSRLNISSGLYFTTECDDRQSRTTCSFTSQLLWKHTALQIFSQDGNFTSTFYIIFTPVLTGFFNP